MRWRRALLIVLICVGPGCAGFQRSWSSGCAENFGSDWVVAQFDMEGRPFNCWKLKETSITNESGSDGIYWKDTKSGHLVHIAGWYNRVQVDSDDYEAAAKLLNVDITKCGNGKYPAN